MLTNLNWLADGGAYPPLAEKERIERYSLNEKLFLSKHTEAWNSDFEEIARRLRRRSSDIETILNYQQLLSKKTADFVCGEPPTIETEQDTDDLIKLLEHQRWGVRLYEAIIDVSRYGNAVLKLVGNGITAVSPRYWFPVVDPSDLKTITQHVIAYPTNPDSKGKATELYVEIHNIGSIETRIYSYDADKHEIGTLKDNKNVSTEINDFAVQVLTNITHSGDLFGVDDYSVVNSIVSKIMWRLQCADAILDKHSAPTMYGPQFMTQKDERTGLYIVQTGNFFEVSDPKAVKPSYLTWDGNLESNWKEIDLLINQLYTLSEMGQAFMEGGGGGEASSGTALKLRMVSPRIKAARLTNLNTATVKQIICLLSEVNGITIDYDGLTLHWSDGLPVDEVEQIQTLISATGGKAVMSQYAAMKRMGLSDTEVEAELEQLSEESASTAPIMLTNIDKNAEDGDD